VVGLLTGIGDAEGDHDAAGHGLQLFIEKRANAFAFVRGTVLNLHASLRWGVPFCWSAGRIRPVSEKIMLHQNAGVG
jgi:hypothetical protein